MNITEKIDCRFFRGDLPCRFHKEKGVHCKDCGFYSPVSKKILIIKLGAAGDVLRTTPLLRKIRKLYPKAEITWVTYFPEFVPSSVENIVKLDFNSTLWLLACEFDFLFNLEKDKEAISLANLVKAKIKKGFITKNNKCFPADNDAVHKWKTGIWDDITRKNKKSYQQEIFEMCGFKFNNEKYILDKPGKFVGDVPLAQPLVGLNTGCGSHWLTRLWPMENWIKLVNKLKKGGFGTILLGGQAEHKRNKEIADATGATYLGFFPIENFISLMNECDAIITGVTMALHIAIALEKRMVLFNNVFNRYEFDLYGLGKILEPKLPCLTCYKTACKNKCMELITPEEVYKTCRKILDY